MEEKPARKKRAVKKDDKIEVVALATLHSAKKGETCFLDRESARILQDAGKIKVVI